MKFIDLCLDDAEALCKKQLENPSCCFAVFRGYGCPPCETYINIFDYDEIQKEYGDQYWYIGQLRLWFGDFLFAGKCYPSEQKIYINWEHPASVYEGPHLKESEVTDLVSKIKEFLF
jgi:hypothetical protein